MTANGNCSHREPVVLARILVPLASFILLALLVAPSIALAQSPEQEAALTEAKQLTEEAAALYRAGKYSQAEPLYRRALPIFEKVLGPEHPQVATILDNLARVLQATGDRAAAKPLYERALKIREEALGPNHSDVAASLHSLATLLHTNKDYAAARPLYERALSIREKNLGANHPDVAQMLHNLALLLQATGDYAAAGPLFERSLKIREKALGPSHIDVARSLRGLAELYRAQGQYARAEPLYRRALGIEEKALGPNHPDVLNSLIRLAEILSYGLRDYSAAKPLYERALRVGEKNLGPSHPDVARSFNGLAETYRAQGEYAQAEPLYRRALEIREKVLGPEHPEVAESLQGLAAIHHAQGKYAQAEPLLRRALAIQEKTFGPEHPQAAFSLQGLAAIYQAQGRYAQAEPLLKRALAFREKNLGRDHPQVARSLNALAAVYQVQGQYAEAEPLYRRALGILEKTFGPEHPDIAQNLNDLAALYRAQGQYSLAEPLFRRALEIREKALGAEHPEVAQSVNNLAWLHALQGQFALAEPLLRRALAIREKSFGPEHPNVAESLNTLAAMYYHKGQYAQSGSLHRRVLGIFEKALGPEHPSVATSLGNVAEVYRVQGQFAQAEPLYHRALAIREKALGPEHPAVAWTLNNLAELYRDQGRFAQAEPFQRRALAIREKVLGPEHPDVATSLNNLAEIYRAQGQYAQVEPLHRRALAIREKVLVPEHPDLAVSLNNLAHTLAGQGQTALARPLYDRARRTQLAVTRVNIDLDEEAQRSLSKKVSSDLQAYARTLANITRKPGLDPSPGSAVADAFVVVEQMRGGVAQSALARASARVATGDPATADLARRVQELGNRQQALERELTEEYGKSAGERNATKVASLQQIAHQINRELAQAVSRLNTAFPRYAELASPEPIDTVTIRQTLDAHEALASFFSLDDRLLVWLLRRGKEPVYKDIEIKKAELGKLVARVRASLDQTANPGLGAGQLLPFDVAGAHELYKLLIEPIREHLSGVKHLIVVPDEVLLPLPFGPLLTRAEGEPYQRLANLYTKKLVPSPAELSDHAKLSWLAKEYAIAVLPSATSLRALRQIPRSRATDVEPLIAFGDPILQGKGRQRGGTMLASRGVTVPIEEIRKLDRLLGTRQELMAVAKVLGVDPNKALYLGERATKPTVMNLNVSGRLGKAQVVSFATHGLIGGEVKGLKEPALVLTPPEKPTEEDDGLLSLEDILKLKLTGTDWAILSACNTAAPDGSGEGLAGLVRAFFFAGAPSLLVSHWGVDDRATQVLMTEVFSLYARDKTMARSEALRQGMLALMAKAKGETAYFAHPYAWAPFFLVGEGAGTILSDSFTLAQQPARPSSEVKTDPKATDATVPVDQSLTPDEYIQLGLPAHDRSWSVEEMMRAVKVLTSLSQKDPRHLPRYRSERSGRVFDRITAAQNLQRFKSLPLPLEQRVARSANFLQTINQLFVLYLTSFAKKATGDSEVVELTGALYRTTVVMVDLFNEFLMTLSQDDPSYKDRMAGLEQMKQGLATMVSGGLDMLTAKDLRATELARLIGYMHDTFPALVPQLPPGSRAETLVRLENMVKDPAMKDLQPGLHELHMKVRSSMERAKSP